MATAYVTLCNVERYNIPRADASRSETVTTSGTAANGALAATVGQVALIYCATHLYARSGGTASQATGIYIPPSIHTPVYMAPGSVISLIDAS